MNQQIHELALAKQNGSERVYDSHDSKCMRMLINSCAVDADDQPIAALSDKPTPGSMVVIGTWIGTITKRTIEPVGGSSIKARFMKQESTVMLRGSEEIKQSTNIFLQPKPISLQ